MIPLLPFSYWTIFTALSPEDAAQILQVRVGERPFLKWGLKKNHWSFEGRVSPSGFNISRSIIGINSFLPVIYGNFTPEQGRLRVEIVAMIHPLVIVFMIVFFAGLYSASGGTGQSLPGLVVFVLVFWAISQTIFLYELNRAKVFFNETFQFYKIA